MSQFLLSSLFAIQKLFDKKLIFAPLQISFAQSWRHNSYAQKSYFFRDAILWKNNVSRKTRLIYFQMLKLKNDQQRFVFIFFRSSIKRRDFLYCSPWTDISPRRKPIGMRCGAKSVKQVRFKISWHFDGVSEIFLIELPFFIHAKSNRS